MCTCPLSALQRRTKIYCHYCFKQYPIWRTNDKDKQRMFVYPCVSFIECIVLLARLLRVVAFQWLCDANGNLDEAPPSLGYRWIAPLDLPSATNTAKRECPAGFLLLVQRCSAERSRLSTTSPIGYLRVVKGGNWIDGHLQAKDEGRGRIEAPLGSVPALVPTPNLWSAGPARMWTTSRDLGTSALP